MGLAFYRPFSLIRLSVAARSDLGRFSLLGRGEIHYRLIGLAAVFLILPASCAF
jgi:hypothetical protein